jgi:hypothetical protein
VRIGDFFNQPYIESKLNSTDLVWIHLGIKPIRFLVQTPLPEVESDSGSTISKSSVGGSDLKWPRGQGGMTDSEHQRRHESRGLGRWANAGPLEEMAGWVEPGLDWVSTQCQIRIGKLFSIFKPFSYSQIILNFKSNLNEV